MSSGFDVQRICAGITVSTPRALHTGVFKTKLVKTDGTSVEIEYRKVENEKEAQANERLIHIHGSLVAISKDIFSRVQRELLPKSASQEDTARCLEYLVSNHCFELRAPRRAAPSVVYGARAFHLLTGALLTPIEMSIGAARLCVRVAELAALVLALPMAKGLELSQKHAVQIQGRKLPSEKIVSLMKTAIRDVKIALLEMIPLVGAKLANLYRSSGSWSEFLDAPALGGLLEAIGCGPAQIVYCYRGWVAHFLYSNIDCERYLDSINPSLQETCQFLNSLFQKSETPDLVPVRIPFEGSHGKLRYHDGTMVFGSGGLTAKTVVLYHGNAMNRDDCFPLAEKYLKRGYNVLMASYAGDWRVEGHGSSHTDVVTSSSEKAMVEDAAADAAFLHSLGVREVAVEGFSLGCAQAMNFAQAICQHHTTDMTVHSVALDCPFTNVPQVCENTVRNSLGSFLGRIAGDLAKRSIMAETKQPAKHGCDGLDNGKKLKTILGSLPFKQTRFAFFGGSHDPVMGPGESISDFNFATELYRMAKKKWENCVCKIFSGAHEVAFDPKYAAAMEELLFS